MGARFSPPPALLLAGLVPLAVLFFRRRHQKALVIVSLCLFTFFGGALCFQASQPVIDEHHPAFYNGRGTVTIEGIVAAEPEAKDRTLHLRLATEAIENGSGRQEISGTVLIYAPRYPTTYSYGDVLRVNGWLEAPAILDDFDYPAYLARQEIYATMVYPRIETITSGGGARPLAWLYSVKSRLSQTLVQVLPEPQASLAQGITLGIRGNIPGAVRDSFARTGTAHLLAISGLHLSILAGIMISITTQLFGKKHYAYVWLTLGAIWLYALITGLAPPVVRASIMVSLFLTAELLGRQRSAVPALVLAAAVMAGINPQILWSASFQMSFMAVLGLIFVTPLLQALGRRIITRRSGEEGTNSAAANLINDTLSVSLGAIIGVGPLVVYYFGIISLVGPPATFLTLPALPAIIILSALSGGLGLIALPAAQVIGWLAWIPLSYLLLVVNTLAAVPAAYIEITSLNPMAIAGYYLALAFGLWYYHRRRQTSILAPHPLATVNLGGEPNE